MTLFWNKIINKTGINKTEKLFYSFIDITKHNNKFEIKTMLHTNYCIV